MFMVLVFIVYEYFWNVLCPFTAKVYLKPEYCNYIRWSQTKVSLNFLVYRWISNRKNLVVSALCSDPHLKGVLFIILESVVQQHTQGHDAAVEFAVLGSPVGMDDNGGLIWQNITSLSALTFLLLLPLSLLFLEGNIFSMFVCDWWERLSIKTGSPDLLSPLGHPPVCRTHPPPHSEVQASPAPWTPPPALPPLAVWWGERSAETSAL